MRATRSNGAASARNRREKKKPGRIRPGFVGCVLTFGPGWRLFGHLHFFDLFLLFGVVVFPFLVVVFFVFVDFFLVGLLFFEFLVRLVGLFFFGRVFFLFVLVPLRLRTPRPIRPSSSSSESRLVVGLVGLEFVFFLLVFKIARLIGLGDDLVATRCWNGCRGQSVGWRDQRSRLGGAAAGDCEFFNSRGYAGIWMRASRLAGVIPNLRARS